MRLRILLKATSKEVSCLQVMSQRAPPYNDKQCELKRTVLTCGSHEEKVLRIHVITYAGDRETTELI